MKDSNNDCNNYDNNNNDTDTHNNNKINNNKKHIDVIDQEVNVMTAVS